MSIANTIIQSMILAVVVFLSCWPLLTWWLIRRYERHLWHPLYVPLSNAVKRRLRLLGALWALLPAGNSFNLSFANQIALKGADNA